MRDGVEGCGDALAKGRRGDEVRRAGKGQRSRDGNSPSHRLMTRNGGLLRGEGAPDESIDLLTNKPKAIGQKVCATFCATFMTFWKRTSKPQQAKRRVMKGCL